LHFPKYIYIYIPSAKYNLLLQASIHKNLIEALSQDNLLSFDYNIFMIRQKSNAEAPH